jgi:hypothetical protein
MNPLYLRHRSSAIVSWVDAPDVTAVVPGQPAGSLPLEKLVLATEPGTIGTCGCSDPTAADDHYVMHAELLALPQSASLAVIQFLLDYKQDALHEAKLARYLDGSFQAADLTNLRVKEENGMSKISFRLGVGL